MDFLFSSTLAPISNTTNTKTDTAATNAFFLLTSLWGDWVLLGGGAGVLFETPGSATSSDDSSQIEGSNSSSRDGPCSDELITTIIPLMIIFRQWHYYADGQKKALTKDSHRQSCASPTHLICKLGGCIVTGNYATRI